MVRKSIPPHEWIDGVECKFCIGCHEYLPLNKYTKLKTSWDKLRTRCRECTAHQGRRHFYGIEIHEYEQMLEEQNGVCKICGGVNKDGKALHVDHCHKTGNVRALLCRNCNLGISYFFDNEGLIEKARDYVIYHHLKGATKF